MPIILKVENVEKYYGGRSNLTRALAGVTFDVEEGEYTGVMGASGSGKTTLLNCVATIDAPTSGGILIDGDDVTAMGQRELARFRREKLGFIFQDFNLLDTLTGYENIALALTILKLPAGEIDRRVADAAHALGITDVLTKYPYQMSGGQRQRIAGARAVVKRPSLVLADEPTGALDSKSARALLESFGELSRRDKATILMVTHDAFAASYCGRILFIRDGKLFHELRRGDEDRLRYFERILEVVGLMGGDVENVL
jgi:putative ABC transport system ATP-binding protein